jgi:hypothetical protein
MRTQFTIVSPGDESMKVRKVLVVAIELHRPSGTALDVCCHGVVLVAMWNTDDPKREAPPAGGIEKLLAIASRRTTKYDRPSYGTLLVSSRKPSMGSTHLLAG